MNRLVLSCAILLVSAAPLAAAPPSADGPADAKKALERKLDRVAIRSSLAEALARQAATTGVRMDVDWPALAQVGVEGKTRVSLKLAGVTTAQLLDITLAKVSPRGKPLAWQLEGDVVRVTTQLRMLRAPLFRVPPAAMPGVRRPAVTTRAAARALTYDFDNTSLRDVIEHFRTTTGVNFYVNWRSLETVAIDPKTAVTLKLRNVAPATALQLALDQLNPSANKFDRVYWVIDDGVVTIATGAALNTELHTQRYDVADLVMPIRNFVGPELKLGASDTTREETDEQVRGFPDLLRLDDDDKDGSDGTGDLEQQNRENLAEAIKASIGEDMWRPQGKGAIRFVGNQMLISQTLLGFKLLRSTTVPR